jgi:hypothetical protein
MKANLPIVIDNPPKPRDPPPPTAPAPQSVSVPAVAVPIPLKKKPVSLPASGDNSYVDQHKDTDFLHRLQKLESKDADEEEMDETEVESKFGIAWVASDEFEDDEKNRSISLHLVTLTSSCKEVSVRNCLE